MDAESTRKCENGKLEDLEPNALQTKSLKKSSQKRGNVGQLHMNKG